MRPMLPGPFAVGMHPAAHLVVGATAALSTNMRSVEQRLRANLCCTDPSQYPSSTPIEPVLSNDNRSR